MVRRRGARAGLVLLLVALASACHDKGDIKVLSLDFQGNSALTRQQLIAVLATKPSGWLPWAPKHYFDKTEFTSDVGRIEKAYADHGYPRAKVADVKVDFNQKRNGVHLRVRIDEGAPIVVESVVLTGFDQLPPTAHATLASLPLKAGAPRDKQLAQASRDTAQRLWHDSGYPYATVALSERRGTSADSVVVTLIATPGPEARFGPVSVKGNTHVDLRVITRTLTFVPGQLYSERQVVESQRRLQTLPVFELAAIDAHATPPAPAVPDVPVAVTVKEAPSQRATFKIGFGSEDKLRVGAEWADLNLFGGAETAGVGAKYSSLERSARVSFGEPAFVWRTAFDATGEAAWSDEPAFVSRNSGGRLTLSRPLGTVSDRSGALSANLRVVYTHEYLSYQIKSDSLGNPNFRAPLIALGLNPDTGKGTGTLGALAFETSLQTTNAPLDPTRGSFAQFRIEHASPSLGGTFQYNEFSTEFRHYIPIGTTMQWAGRVRFGTIMAGDDADVPFSGRYFLGGSTTLRGWGRYEVSPLSPNGETIGGRTRFELSTEWRRDIGERTAFVVFLDAGNVWPGSWDIHTNDLRYDVGPGLRYKTVVGALRLDVGYQLNPITGLVVNGNPSTRRWRIHFGIGEAF